MAFEHPFGGFLIGALTAAVEDPAGIEPPSTIIQTDDAWNIRVDWSVDGGFAPFLGGDWHVSVFVESIGPGFEGQVGGPVDVPVADAPPAPLPREYSATVGVAAGDLAAGTYKVVTLLNYDNGGFPQEMAAFQEGPVVQLYEPS
jgi:hypothetical protein